MPRSRAASRESFDAVILDVDMPGIDGLAVGRALRGDPRTRQSMIAMHTSLAEADVRTGFDGYDAFLPKPCDARLSRRVRRPDDPDAPAARPRGLLALFLRPGRIAPRRWPVGPPRLALPAHAPERPAP